MILSIATSLDDKFVDEGKQCSRSAPYETGIGRDDLCLRRKRFQLKEGEEFLANNKEVGVSRDSRFLATVVPLARNPSKELL